MITDPLKRLPDLSLNSSSLRGHLPMPGAFKQGEEKMGKMKENEDLNRKDDKQNGN
jgi:hypothetical protein